jgi:hypothetical protein
MLDELWMHFGYVSKHDAAAALLEDSIDQNAQRPEVRRFFKLSSGMMQESRVQRLGQSSLFRVRERSPIITKSPQGRHQRPRWQGKAATNFKTMATQSDLALVLEQTLNPHSAKIGRQ